MVEIRSENQVHAAKNNLLCQKLSSNDVVAIKMMIKSGSHKRKDIAKMFNVDPSTIGSIKSGRSWRHV